MARGRKKVVKAERSYKNPNGFGTVYELKTGNRRKPFAARVTTGWNIKFINGKPHKQQIKKVIGYAETYEKAVALLTDYHRRENAGMEIVKADATFDEIYQIVLNRRIKGKSESLKAVYTAAYNYLVPICKMPLSEIRTGNMQKCIDDAYDNGKSYSTLSNIKLVCKMVYEYGLQNDLINKDYSGFLKVQKTDKKTIRTPFTPEEIDMVWNSSLDNADTVLIMLYTGIRINELLKIKIEDVHLNERYFITGSKTDAGKNRMIPIAKPIEQLMKNRFDIANNYLIEFSGKKVTPSYYRENIWKPIMNTLNIEHLPHDCRHTFCSITDNAGMNRVVQQKIVGHKGKNVTENVYIHKDIEHILKEVDKVWPSYRL